MGDLLMDYVALGSRVKNKRLSMNMTQEQLAELVGISSVYVGQIERGDRHMTIDTLVKMSEILDTSVEELLKDTVTHTNSRITELNNIVRELKVEDIDRIINVVKAMYL